MGGVPPAGCEGWVRFGPCLDRRRGQAVVHWTHGTLFYRWWKLSNLTSHEVRLIRAMEGEEAPCLNMTF